MCYERQTEQCFHSTSISDLLDPEEAEMLNDLLVAACNDAIRQLNEASEQKMSSVTGGMKLPGM